MSGEPAPPAGSTTIALGLACLETGMLLQVFDGQSATPGVVRVAAAAPALFATDAAVDWTDVFERLGERGDGRFRDVVVVADDRVHAIRRLAGESETAVIAVGSGTANVGLVLSAVQARARELESR
jgi:hypothetical protein